jgi:hypothetical protein
VYGQGDINNDRDAILAAARFLVAHGGPAVMAGAVFGYNPSSGYVRAVQSYAERLAADEREFRGYYQWQVVYSYVKGAVILPVGYPEVVPEPLD